jgi:aldehyde dehydrogenase (NAD+)
MHLFDKHYVGGAWVQPSTSELIDVVNASTEEVMGRVSSGTPDDVSRAVESARSAFEQWSATPVAERANLLDRVGQALAAKADVLARTISGEVGTPLKLSNIVQVGFPVKNWSIFANLAREYRFEEALGNSLVTREPIGVVACITPWNYPLHQVVAKVAPALAAGCTVVLKPSEVAPLTAFMLTEMIHEAGFPPGVFNLVCGYGTTVG